MDHFPMDAPVEIPMSLNADAAGITIAKEIETEIETGTETVTEIATEIVTEDAAVIPDQCPALGIVTTVAVIITITEALRDLISRESEEGRPAAVIIAPSKTKRNTFYCNKKSGSIF